MPEFGFKGKMLIARLFEERHEDAESNIRSAELARRAFASALMQEDADPAEIAERGEALKRAMRTVGDEFLDIMIEAAPKLPSDERKELAAFLTSLPTPTRGMSLPAKPDDGVRREEGDRLPPQR